ncbi:MAG TPA: magnesium/cobalt transporter CorA, partial [bacterium]|nr:magnesium/cobalt transporter CorA [bacterium]
LEEELMSNPESNTLGKIYRLKRDIFLVRKSVWPLRDVVSRLERGEIDVIEQKTEIYLRDLYDHIVQVIDTVETFRDMSTGLLDLYLSSVSFKMNDVMKVLTIISTIFIPLTFIAGVYGMNFENMPELKWSYGYFISLGLMLVIFVSMVIFFKKKKWW